MDERRTTVAGTRRRGAELEDAIHRAVLDQLDAHGYAGITFEGVAAAAGTSKPVLYRRWPTKAELVFAALRTMIRQIVLAVPDTGTLSGDLSAALGAVRDHLDTFDRRTLLGLIAEVDERTADALRQMLFDVGARVVTPITQRAAERGELADMSLPDWLLAVPFDLARHDLLITGALPDERIEAIVTAVALPAWQNWAG
nr:hypothetical protein ISGA_3097 [Gordonia sp. NB41Y]